VQRWTAFLFAALLVGAVAFVVMRGGPKALGQGQPDAGADAATDASDAIADAGVPADAEAPAEPTTDAGGTLLTGEAPPALPAEAPKSVVFGVILVVYKGAQGAPPTSRPRDEALELARTLAAEAKQDFKAAVAKGDKGSMENAGRLPRGMLEPAPEYVLFTLPKGGVSEPVDTPRGFWIAHRIE
jgi:hypothetical protein